MNFIGDFKNSIAYIAFGVRDIAFDAIDALLVLIFG